MVPHTRAACRASVARRAPRRPRRRVGVLRARIGVSVGREGPPPTAAHGDAATPAPARALPRRPSRSNPRAYTVFVDAPSPFARSPYVNPLAPSRSLRPPGPRRRFRRGAHRAPCVSREATPGARDRDSSSSALHVPAARPSRRGRRAPRSRAAAAIPGLLSCTGPGRRGPALPAAARRAIDGAAVVRRVPHVALSHSARRIRGLRRAARRGARGAAASASASSLRRSSRSPSYGSARLDRVRVRPNQISRVGGGNIMCDRVGRAPLVLAG